MIIEEQDKKILRALQSNARMSNQELADAVNMSSSSLDRDFGEAVRQRCNIV